MYKWQQVGALRSGQILIVKSVDELEREFGGLGADVPGFFNNAMKAYCGCKFHVTPDNKDLITKAMKGTYIFHDGGFGFSPAMLKTTKEELNAEIKLEAAKNKKKNDSTSTKGEVKKKEDKILDEVELEMIGKVNYEMIKSLFAVGTRNHAKIDEINDDIVKEYIKNWAIAKKDIYLMFGRSFTLKKKIMMNKTTSEMSTMIYELGKEFPIYGVHMGLFETNDFIENTISDVPSVYRKYAEGMCKTGAKLSRFFSALLKDPKFDIELSKILQNRQIEGTIEISIDPVDFLTMSIHKHKWCSCFNIYDGCFSNCAFSMMQDDCSMIAFKHNGKMYDYSIPVKNGKYEYSWNSKQSRSVVAFDKKTKAIGIYRAQGSPDDSYYTVIADMIKNCSTSFYDIKSPFEKISFYDGNVEQKEKRYGHVHDDLQYYYIPSDSRKERVVINLGVNQLYNPVNGKSVDSSSVLW